MSINKTQGSKTLQALKGERNKDSALSFYRNGRIKGECMETLKEKEWITLNKVILEIYSIENMAQFAPHILQICRNLVPDRKSVV